MQHVHKYKRENLTRDPKKAPYIVYRCVLPECNHHVPYKLAEGKQCICWRCTKVFTLAKKHVDIHNGGLAKPHCDGCTKTSKTKKKVQSSIESLMDILDVTKL